MGGEVVFVIGNHEALRMHGKISYAFRDPFSGQVREDRHIWNQFVAWRKLVLSDGLPAELARGLGLPGITPLIKMLEEEEDGERTMATGGAAAAEGPSAVRGEENHSDAARKHRAGALAAQFFNVDHGLKTRFGTPIDTFPSWPGSLSLWILTHGRVAYVSAGSLFLHAGLGAQLLHLRFWE